MSLIKFEEQHVIIFQDKSRVHLSGENYRKFMTQMQGKADGVLMGSNYYRFSSIAKILTQAEFYEQYPQHIPSSKPKPVESEPTEALSPERLRAGWIRAMKIAKQDNPNITWEMLKRMIGSNIKKYGITQEEVGIH